MKKNISCLSALFVVLLASCTTIQITEYTSRPLIPEQSLVAIDKIGGLSTQLSFYYYQEILEASGLQTLYVSEYEYDLVATGLQKNKLNNITAYPEAMERLRTELNADYLLRINVSRVALVEGQYVSQANAPEAQPIYRSDYPQRNAQVWFTLQSLSKPEVYYQYTVDADISPVEVKDRDTGETLTGTINVSTPGMALQKALKKGIEHIEEVSRSYLAQ